MPTRELTGHTPEYFEFLSDKSLAKALRQMAKWLDAQDVEEPHVISMTVDYRLNEDSPQGGTAAIYAVVDRSV